MHTVPVPDPLFDEVQRAATAIGLSVEAYVIEALQQQINEDRPLTLSPSQLDAIATAESDIDTDNFLTASQVREHFNKKKGSWPKNPG